MENLNLNHIYNASKSIKVVILIMASLCVIFLVYFFDFKNLNNKFTANEEKIASIKEQYRSLLHKQFMLANETAEFNNLTLSYNALKKQIVPYSRLNKVIDEILKIGSSNNIYFSNFNPNDEIKKGTYIVVPIKINGVGSYPQLARFLSQIASVPYVIFIGDFTIANSSVAKSPTSTSATTSDTTVTNGNMLTADFNMEVYSLAQ